MRLRDILHLWSPVWMCLYLQKRKSVCSSALSELFSGVYAEANFKALKMCAWGYTHAHTKTLLCWSYTQTSMSVKLSSTHTVIISAGRRWCPPFGHIYCQVVLSPFLKSHPLCSLIPPSCLCPHGKWSYCMCKTQPLNNWSSRWTLTVTNDSDKVNHYR